MKTSELIGPALDWAVAACEGVRVEIHSTAAIMERRLRSLTPDEAETLPQPKPYLVMPGKGRCEYSTDWAQGGPITDREHIEIRPTITEGGYRTSDSPDAVHARILLPNGATVFNPCAVISEYGPTALIAAMRCYVASKLGDEIAVPNELREL
jgi:hypothetical protein